MSSNPSELPVAVSPEEISGYSLSQKAAEQCREIVESTAKIIEGRKYVQVEGWQAIAIAHQCVASARDVEAVYYADGSLSGYRAVGEVKRMADGVAIATGEGFVGVDEVVWFGGKRGNKTYSARPIYAVRAMAQTRGISRACRSAFAHVVVIINRELSTTPAEEMETLNIETMPSMMEDARAMSLASGHPPGAKPLGAHRKAGAPVTKDDLIKRQDAQVAAAIKWVEDHRPMFSLMKLPTDLAEWENNEEIKPRLDALRQGRDDQPGYEHLKAGWAHYERVTKEAGLRP